MEADDDRADRRRGAAPADASGESSRRLLTGPHVGPDPSRHGGVTFETKTSTATRRVLTPDELDRGRQASRSEEAKSRRRGTWQRKAEDQAQSIAALHRDGLVTKAIATKLGTSERKVKAIIRAATPPNPANYCRSCRQDFNGVSLFDAHRVGTHECTLAEGLRMSPPREDGRRCLDSEEMKALGWALNERGRWSSAGNDSDE